MTRESRIVVTLLVMAGAGVSGLMLVANQYKKAIAHAAPRSPRSDDATIRAVRLVDGYLAARDAVKHVIETHPVAAEQWSANPDASNAYRAERFNAFAQRGLTYDDYVLVRGAWRTYRSGGRVEDEALVGAFQARPQALQDADLGPFESLDDAIK
jgi:hypothetical protein